MRSRTLLPLLHLSGLPLAGSLAACGEWPRHEHPPDTTEAVSVDAQPRDVLAAEVTWGEPDWEVEPNDVPTWGDLLSVNTGWQIHGALDGWGWNAAAEPDRDPMAPCVYPVDFPPSEATADGDGDYAGDVDWISLRVPEIDEDPALRPTLCASVRLELSQEVSDPIFDMLLYDLDECLQPVTAWHEPGTQGGGDAASILGYAQRGAEAEWAVQVPQGAWLGIPLAGFHPPGVPDLLATWQLSLSLVTPDDDPLLCPTAAFAEAAR